MMENGSAANTFKVPPSNLSFKGILDFAPIYKNTNILAYIERTFRCLVQRTYID